MGVYDKEPLLCNDHSDKKISKLVKNPLIDFLFILYKPLVNLLNWKALKNHPKSKVTLLGYKIFSRTIERLYTKKI